MSHAQIRGKGLPRLRRQGLAAALAAPNLLQNSHREPDAESWVDKIRTAKLAREAGRKLREGKAKAFRADGWS